MESIKGTDFEMGFLLYAGVFFLHPPIGIIRSWVKAIEVQGLSMHRLTLFGYPSNYNNQII